MPSASRLDRSASDFRNQGRQRPCLAAAAVGGVLLVLGLGGLAFTGLSAIARGADGDGRGVDAQVRAARLEERFATTFAEQRVPAAVVDALAEGALQAHQLRVLDAQQLALVERARTDLDHFGAERGAGPVLGVGSRNLLVVGVLSAVCGSLGALLVVARRAPH